jgi:succinoglycan biosynthesis transport protein ExoP
MVQPLGGAASQTPARQDSEDHSPDVPGYLAALRRGAWLMVLIVVPLTGTVLALSLLLPKTYSATASLVLEEPSGVLEAPSADTSARRLATIRRLLTSRGVLERAAADLPGESADTLEDKVTASVDELADIVEVKALDDDPVGAAAIANGVTSTFLEARRAAERQQLTVARRELEQALRRLESSGGTASEIQALRQRRDELSVREAGVSAGLQVAESARPADGPDSPRPVQNTIFAFFAALFLAVLAALGRGLMAPRLSGPRELTARTGLQPLVVMPARRRRRRAAEAAEAYQALAASVRLQLSESQRVVLVSGAHPDADRAAVAVGLGRALASSGLPTLLVSADLRRPTLHKQLSVPQAPGLGEVLSALERDPGESAAELIRSATRARERPTRGELRALPSGDTAQHPAAMLAGESLGVVFEHLGRSEYRYVVVEGPSLLGPIDGQLVARWADAILVVCRLDALSPDDAVELGEGLARLHAPVLGSVVIGGTQVRYSLPAWTPVREKGEVTEGV